MPQVEALMLTRSSADWAACLEAAGIPCAPVNTLAEIANEAQTAAVEMLQAIPGLGEFVRLPLSFDGTRPAITRPAPQIGQHNGEILPEGVIKT